MRTFPQVSRPFGELGRRASELTLQTEGNVSPFLGWDLGKAVGCLWKASLGGFSGLLDLLWSRKSSVPEFYLI